MQPHACSAPRALHAPRAVHAWHCVDAHGRVHLCARPWPRPRAAAPAPAPRGLVKPDIVFFGEGLPERFYDLAERDFPACDLLVVMGTSLVVHPFASLIGGRHS